MYWKQKLFWWCQILIVILFFGCFSTINVAYAEQNTNTPLKVGFIMVGSANDYGWNYAHDQGRKFLENTLTGKVQTTFAENISESAEVERVMEKMIAQGNKLIFSTSYGYLEPVLRVAARHPDVIFMQCSRPNPQPMKNVGTYSAHFYDVAYATGVVAGHMTKKNKIGFVAAHPIPVVLLCLNAFTLGARSVNHKAKTYVIWTNNWNDAPTEAEAAKSFIDQGVDVLGTLVSAPAAVVKTAEKNHIYVVCDNVDLQRLAPTCWLTGSYWDWRDLYVTITKSVLNHTWKPENKRYSAKDGVIKLSSFGPAVPKTVQQEATNLMHQIADGKFTTFRGPMKDRDGNLRIPAGKTADDRYLETIDWVVPGVEGTLPKK